MMPTIRYQRPAFRPEPERTLILSTADAIAAETVARGRQAANEARGIKSKKRDDSRTDIEIHTEGAYGEAGFARLCGGDWFERWYAIAVNRSPLSQEPDVGPFHVRACAPGKRLLVKPGDILQPPYALVWVRSESATVAFCGWAFGFEIAVPRYKRDEFKPAIWLRPAETLYGWESLWAWYASRFGGP